MPDIKAFLHVVNGNLCLLRVEISQHAKAFGAHEVARHQRLTIACLVSR
jgi:hypothetical protein